MSNTHEWCAEGIQPEITKLHLKANRLPWWMERIQNLKYLYIPLVADLPNEAWIEKELLQAQGIQSLLVVPMVHVGNLIGFLGFDSVKKVKSWSADAIIILESAA